MQDSNAPWPGNSAAGRFPGAAQCSRFRPPYSLFNIPLFKIATGSPVNGPCCTRVYARALLFNQGAHH